MLRLYLAEIFFTTRFLLCSHRTKVLAQYLEALRADEQVDFSRLSCTEAGLKPADSKKLSLAGFIYSLRPASFMVNKKTDMLGHTCFNIHIY